MNEKKCLFIVGMPRSGTKLLRDLCNGHSLINIPEVETHFIPKFYKNFTYHGKPNFRDYESLYQAISKTTFYDWMHKKGCKLTIKELQQNIDLNNWESIISFLLQHFSSKNDEDYLYFGDKTPDYINHLPLLKHIFPKSKILIIIRDPRDYCLSNRKIWGKNIYRAAINWHTSITKLYSDINNFTKDIAIIKYEDLINTPEKTLKSICAFLEIRFENEMIKLKTAPENYGDAKGLTSIKKDNTNKFKTQLTKKEIQKIEELSYNTLIKYYEPIYAKSFNKISKFQLQYLKFFDGINSWRFHIKDRGFINGTNYFFKLHTETT